MYSLCISYANDFLSPKQMTSAAGTLIFASGLGMIIGPPIASFSIRFFGLEGFLPVIGFVHFTLGAYALWRMTQRAAIPQEGQGPFIAVPIKNTQIAGGAMKSKALCLINNEELIANAVKIA